MYGEKHLKSSGILRPISVLSALTKSLMWAFDSVYTLFKKLPLTIEYSRRRILYRRRDLYTTTQHSQQKNIQAPSWIRTHNHSSRAVADLLLRPRGHWDCRVKKIKQSHYRPGQVLRFPSCWRFQISRHSAHEGGKVVSRTHRPPLPSRKYSCYSFLLEAESTPLP